MIQEKNLSDVCVSSRQQVGQRTGVIGITVNALLFSIKLTLGLLNNSVSVIADGFNNLGDCASSLVTTIGFHLSGKTTDEKHPYGYGRMEYISGFVVAMLIIMTALSVGKSSIVHMLYPEQPTLTMWIFVAQGFAVVVKLAFALYIHVVNSKLGSAALNATFKDSMADSVVTTVTLLSLLASQFTTLPVDGIAGLIVAIMILWAGITSFKEHLDLLIILKLQFIGILPTLKIIMPERSITMGAVTVSKENYLKSILLIKREKGYVRASEIAALMNVTRPSVSHAVHQLESENYIQIDNERNILLTPIGLKIATSVLEKYETFYKLLLSLGVPNSIASIDAGRIEHVVSDDSFILLKNMVVIE